ncbi:MAG: hypothetical protein HQM09_12165 [Candidatus Riflebacteria bacterium]|nr:hypothetical protein [Candidatus Riflebacteria bacterium]
MSLVQSRSFYKSNYFAFLCRRVASVIIGVILTFFVMTPPADAQIKARPATGTENLATNTENIQPKLDKVERSWGLRPFRMSGYQTFVEPRIAFIKRKKDFSEVIEYSWRPLLILDMPHKERIDRIQFSFNRYYFTGPEKRSFYGGGLGGNIILFNQSLKSWGKDRALDLKDGVNGLGRVFLGYKWREIRFLGETYPVVLRVDGIFSPSYEFGGNLGRAGDKLNLTEIRGGLSFSIE